MTETPIQELRALLDGSLRLLADDGMPSGLLVHALDVLAAVEADAAIGAAVRECEERGLDVTTDFTYTNYDIRYNIARHEAAVATWGQGPTLLAAMADWKLRNGVQA